MRIATFATTACLALLGTIVCAQSVTYDFDRSANFHEIQDVRLGTGHQSERPAESPAHRARGGFPIERAGILKGGCSGQS
jgi:hypothetical protein